MSAFRDELQRAIAARDISLGQLAAEVTAAGTKVTRATLSYWVNGKTEPRRGSSFEVVLGLEKVLDLPAGTLVQHLEIKTPDQATSPPATTPFASIPEAIQQLRGEWGIPEEDGLHRVLMQVRLDLNPFIACISNRLVLRAEHPHADRFIFSVPVGTGTTKPALGELQVLRGARLGRRSSGVHGAIVHEIVLGHPLDEGEFAEVILLNAGATPQVDRVENLEIQTMRPVSTLAVQVRFPFGMPPQRVRVETENTDRAGHKQLTERIMPVTNGVAHATLSPVTMGGARVTWEPLEG